MKPIPTGTLTTNIPTHIDNRSSPYDIASIYWITITILIITILSLLLAGLIVCNKRKEDQKEMKPQGNMDVRDGHYRISWNPRIPTKAVTKDMVDVNGSKNEFQIQIHTGLEESDLPITERNNRPDSFKEFADNYISFLFRLYERHTILQDNTAVERGDKKDSSTLAIPQVSLDIKNKTTLHATGYGKNLSFKSDAEESDSKLTVSFTVFKPHIPVPPSPIDTEFDDEKFGNRKSTISLAATECDEVYMFVERSQRRKSPDFKANSFQANNALDYDEGFPQSPLEDKIFTWMGEDDFTSALQLTSQLLEGTRDNSAPNSTVSSETVKADNRQIHALINNRDINANVEDPNNNRDIIPSEDDPIFNFLGGTSPDDNSWIHLVQAQESKIANPISTESFKTCNTHFSSGLGSMVKQSQSSFNTFHTARTNWLKNDS